mmetsp:Transcript_13145/g.27972  ORF Transcript_13145/g.27972 Transcript_13145/m.27972 type:complete len:208 (-) Transcript_13145:149-772(-)
MVTSAPAAFLIFLITLTEWRGTKSTFRLPLYVRDFRWSRGGLIGKSESKRESGSARFLNTLRSTSAMTERSERAGRAGRANEAGGSGEPSVRVATRESTCIRAIPSATAWWKRTTSTSLSDGRFDETACSSHHGPVAWLASGVFATASMSGSKSLSLSTVLKKTCFSKAKGCATHRPPLGTPAMESKLSSFSRTILSISSREGSSSK